MDAKVAYWTAAFINLGFLTGLAFVGVLRARRGEVARHRRAITVAGALVVIFLLSYPFKLWFLGRENLTAWSDGYVYALRFHETCIALMLIAAITAARRGLRLVKTAAYTDTTNAPPTMPGMKKQHGWAGRLAVFGALLAWVSSGVVLFGMYARL